MLSNPSDVGRAAYTGPYRFGEERLALCCMYEQEASVRISLHINYHVSLLAVGEVYVGKGAGVLQRLLPSRRRTDVGNAIRSSTDIEPVWETVIPKTEPWQVLSHGPVLSD